MTKNRMTKEEYEIATSRFLPRENEKEKMMNVVASLPFWEHIIKLLRAEALIEAKEMLQDRAKKEGVTLTELDAMRAIVRLKDATNGI